MQPAPEAAMAAVSACPDVQSLQRFLLGQIGGAEAEALEHHLEQCDRCLASSTDSTPKTA